MEEPLSLVVCSQAAPGAFPGAMEKEGFKAGQNEAEYTGILQKHRWFKSLPLDFIHKR